jgi:hypothetical protein
MKNLIKVVFMKKEMIYSSLFLFLLTGCTTQSAENQVTLAQMTEEIESSALQEKEHSYEEQSKPTKENKVQESTKIQEEVKTISPKIEKQEKSEVNSQEREEPPSVEQTDNDEKKDDSKQQAEQEIQQNSIPEQEKKNANLENYLTWDEFFDNGDQTTPSEKFWNLKGQQVTIDGFMGEVLSLDGGWFLLIPAPGAECPFDNGDESYWNKIMIVFVKDKKDLRFTHGPLRLKGRLDVGIKVDESNYKTMFRLYDATFEKMK